MTTLIVLDEEITFGFRTAAGGWSTSIVPLSGGLESRNQNWAVPRRRYEFSFAGKTETEIRTIMAFVDDRRGMLHPFLFKDWLNYRLTDEIILTATGGETTAQIIQTWGPDTAFSRDVNYIKSGTLVVTKNATPWSTPGDYTVSATGLLTFSALAPGDILRVTAEFYVKVRFETDLLGPTLDHPDIAQLSSISAIEVLS